jgi:small acid-soluble spore protein (thioredoxin-like protein)
MDMKSKPDDRRDNAEKIQKNIGNTAGNIRQAGDMRAMTDDERMKRELEQKNDRRKAVIDSMMHEVKDGAQLRAPD